MTAYPELYTWRFVNIKFDGVFEKSETFHCKKRKRFTQKMVQHLKKLQNGFESYLRMKDCMTHP